MKKIGVFFITSWICEADNFVFNCRLLPPFLITLPQARLLRLRFSIIRRFAKQAPTGKWKKIPVNRGSPAFYECPSVIFSLCFENDWFVRWGVPYSLFSPSASLSEGGVTAERRDGGSNIIYYLLFILYSLLFISPLFLFQAMSST